MIKAEKDWWTGSLKWQCSANCHHYDYYKIRDPMDELDATISVTLAMKKMNTKFERHACSVHDGMHMTDRQTDRHTTWCMLNAACWGHNNWQIS